ncbi:MAG: TVP38/TMEM64 family protein [Myxococcota bacterium]
MRRVLPGGLLLLLVLALAGGQLVRRYAGIEVSVDSIQAWVASLGWRGPVVYVGLVAFRPFLLLPSWVVLAAGGLVFGVIAGTLLGGAGVLVSALAGYSLARWAGAEWLRPRMGPRVRAVQRRVERAGPLIVGLATAHPVGPMSAFHVAAGLSSVPLLGFVLAVAIGGPARAFLLSIFGTTLADPGSGPFLVTTLGLIAIALLPLAHPRFRRALARDAGGLEEH